MINFRQVKSEENNNMRFQTFHPIRDASEAAAMENENAARLHLGDGENDSRSLHEARHLCSRISKTSLNYVYFHVVSVWTQVPNDFQ